MIKKERTIILGNGFIGKYLYEKLKKSQEIIKLSSEELKIFTNNNNEKFFTNFTSETNLIITLGIKRQNGDNLISFKKNKIINEYIQKILLKYKFKKVVYISSLSVYGDSIDHSFLNEDNEINPNTYYGESKCDIENKLKQIKNNEIYIFRFPLIYGNSDTSVSYGPTLFVNNLINNKIINIYGDGTELREFLYITDVAEIISIALKENINKNILNIVRGQSYSFMYIVNILKNMHNKININNFERTKNKCNQTYNNLNFTYAFSNFEFTSLKISLEKMLKNENI